MCMYIIKHIYDNFKTSFLALLLCCDVMLHEANGVRGLAKYFFLCRIFAFGYILLIKK